MYGMPAQIYVNMYHTMDQQNRTANILSYTNHIHIANGYVVSVYEYVYEK